MTQAPRAILWGDLMGLSYGAMLPQQRRKRGVKNRGEASVGFDEGRGYGKALRLICMGGPQAG